MFRPLGKYNVWMQWMVSNRNEHCRLVGKLTRYFKTGTRSPKAPSEIVNHSDLNSKFDSNFFKPFLKRQVNTKTGEF